MKTYNSKRYTAHILKKPVYIILIIPVVGCKLSKGINTKIASYNRFLLDDMELKKYVYYLFDNIYLNSDIICHLKYFSTNITFCFWYNDFQFSILFVDFHFVFSEFY